MPASLPSHEEQVAEFLLHLAGDKVSRASTSSAASSVILATTSSVEGHQTPRAPRAFAASLPASARGAPTPRHRARAPCRARRAFIASQSAVCCRRDFALLSAPKTCGLPREPSVGNRADHIIEVKVARFLGHPRMVDRLNMRSPSSPAQFAPGLRAMASATSCASSIV